MKFLQCPYEYILNEKTSQLRQENGMDRKEVTT